MPEELTILGNLEIDRVRFLVENLGWKIIAVSIDEGQRKINMEMRKIIPEEARAPGREDEVRL